MPSKRILIVEDDLAILQLVRERLSRVGYQTHTARNGLEAISQLLALKPDAMVLDINMPEMDGFAVLQNLKAHDLMLPVLVLTARHAADDVRKAVMLGAKDYLTKPFTEVQLLARVQRLLRPQVPATVRAAQMAAANIADVLSI